MKIKRVRFTRTAQRQVEQEQAWWSQHGDYPDVFRTELEGGVRILSVLPGAGTPYALSPIPGVRRLYLGKIASHLYYTFDEDEVIVRALWGARRDRGPTIR